MPLELKWLYLGCIDSYYFIDLIPNWGTRMLQYTLPSMHNRNTNHVYIKRVKICRGWDTGLLSQSCVGLLVVLYGMHKAF